MFTHFDTNICGQFGIFFPFWFYVERKIWQPCPHSCLFLLLGLKLLHLLLVVLAELVPLLE
jgi:hypothetical protein